MGCLLVVDLDDVLVRSWPYRLVTFLMETLYVDICIVIVAVVSIYIRHRKHPMLSKCILTVALAALVCREYAFYQFTFQSTFWRDPTDGDIDLGNMVENISIINSKVDLNSKLSSIEFRPFDNLAAVTAAVSLPAGARVEAMTAVSPNWAVVLTREGKLLLA